MRTQGNDGGARLGPLVLEHQRQSALLASAEVLPTKLDGLWQDVVGRPRAPSVDQGFTMAGEEERRRIGFERILDEVQREARELLRGSQED